VACGRIQYLEQLRDETELNQTVTWTPKLLSNNPALKVGIVGHTDIVGNATAFKGPSMKRVGKQQTPEQILSLVRQVEVAMAKKKATPTAPASLAFTAGAISAFDPRMQVRF
jgi:hypothetical protein